MRQAGQRLIFKWTAFFEGEFGFRGQQHHSLGITTGWYVGIIYYL